MIARSVRPRARRALIERLMDKVSPEPNTGCWLWLGAHHNPWGYGRFGDTYAHRVTYELFKGPIPQGCEIDHKCRVPECCNPDHLEAVSHSVNMQRSPTVGRKGHVQMTHCPQGHLYDQENTYYYRKNRMCRTCRRLSNLLAGRRRRANVNSVSSSK